MKPEKKTHQVQHNYSSLPVVEMQLRNHQIRPELLKTFRIVQQGEVSLLRVAYF